ncbi:MAG TPA: hypothetical protein VLF68_01450 [Candidatus Saccharimonadales bacterium]|nr:hypothetical protein [Candidatus Saccharimonadales bacterium]
MKSFLHDLRDIFILVPYETKRFWQKPIFWGNAALLFLLYAIFYGNTLHESYPDEFDNMLGGKLILHGSLPYIGFFSHHGPVSYFVGAIVYLFSGMSFVRFRIVYSILLFLFSLYSFSFIKKSAGFVKARFYLIFLFIFGIAATYFWGHMLIADNIAAIFIAPVFVLLLLKALFSQPLTRRDTVFISILTALTVLSSVTYIYLVGIFYLFTVYLYWLENRRKLFARGTFWFLITLAAPYIVFALYLFVTRSFSQWLYQSIVFNQKYYIYYEGSSGQVTTNPIRFGIIIANQFFNNFHSLLNQSFTFNFVYPLNITLALGNVALIVYLLFKRKFTLASFVILAFIFANGRSNPLTSGEKDYQSAVYILLSLASFCFVVPAIFTELKEREYNRRLLFSALFVLLSIYGFFSFLFLMNKFTVKMYGKYMGTAPLIYDRPQIAPIINQVSSKNDYVWIGPLEFGELTYVNGKLPSKYQFLIPAMSKSDRIMTELMSEFNNHKPAVIWFDKRYFILGSSPEKYAQFFLDFLHQNYVTLDTYRNGNIRYVSAGAPDPRVDLETKLYINKDQKDAIIAKMLSLGIIKESIENEKPQKK